MSGEPSPTVVPPEPTDVRFSMRALLLLTLGVAIAAAALGPYFRGLSPDQRAPVAMLWGVCWIVVLSWVGYHARNRFRLERQAGRTILALAPRGKWLRHTKPWLIILGGCLWIGWGLYHLVMSAQSFNVPPNIRTPIFFSFALPGLVSAMFISLGIATIWWSQKVQLREHGVLRGLRLLRWSHVTDHHWKDDTVFFEGVDQRHIDAQLAVIVTADQREAVRSLLAQKLSVGARFMPGDVPGVGPTTTKLPHIDIQAGQRLTLRGMISVITVYVAIIAILLFRPWGTPSRDFNTGVEIGCGIAVLTIAFGAWRAGKAGAPLVRLLTRMDWPSAIGAALLSVGCYYADQQLLFPNPLVGGIFGIGCGLGISAILGMLLRDKFDLCENGVMLIRWTFLPWNSVRVSKWNRDGNGRLLLRCGWRRIAGKVSPEQREAVDRVLREKVAP